MIELYKIRPKSNILNIPESGTTFTYDQSSQDKAESTIYDCSYYNITSTQTMPSTLVTIKLEEPGTTKLRCVLHHLHPGSYELLKEIDTLCSTKPSGWESRFFSWIQQVESCVISLRHAVYRDTTMPVDPWIDRHCKADEALLQKLSDIFRDRVLTLDPSSPLQNTENLMAWGQALMIHASDQSASSKIKRSDDSSIGEVVGTLKLGDARSCTVAFHRLKDPSLLSLSGPLQVATMGSENQWRFYTLHHLHPSRAQILQKTFELYLNEPDQLPAYFQETLRAFKTCSKSLKQISKGQGKLIKDPWLRREYKADKATLRFLINLGLKLSGTKTGD